MNLDSISNRYQLMQQIGKGGQGTVYLAKSKLTNEEVALKVIQLTPTNQENVIREIGTIKSMSNPHCIPYIVCYHDSFYDQVLNQVVIEMNYVKGPNIAQYTQPLRNSGNRPLLILTTKLFIKAMLIALKFIHSHGILHNDIKPSNIVVGHDKVPVLVDFGIACFTSFCNNLENCCITNAGTSIYLPPEVIKKVRYPGSDLWSLGATAYEIMSGMNIWNLNVMSYDPMGLLREVINLFKNNIQPNKLMSGDKILDDVINGFLLYNPSDRMSIDQALILLNSFS